MSVTSRAEGDDAGRRRVQKYVEVARPLLDALPQMVWVSRADGQIEYINRCGATALRLQDESPAPRWQDAVHRDDLERATRVWEAAVRSGLPYRNEYRVRAAGEGYRWQLAQGSPMRDDQGEVLFWIGSWTDLEPTKQTQHELRRTREMLHAVASNTSDAVFVKDLDGVYQYCNAAMAEVIGRPPAAIIGQTDAKFFDAAAAAAVRDHDQHVLKTQRASTREETLTVGSAQRVFLATKAPYRDGDGKIIGLVGISRDITERKNAEMALRMHDRAIQAVSQGILITDPNQPDNPVVFANAGFERLTGYAPDETLGRNCRFLQGKETDAESVQRLREAIDERQAVTLELMNHRKDGTAFWNELSISPVRDAHGRLTHFVGVQSDVTARRRLEEQLRKAQKMEAVGQLAGGVAHDFNNLLTIIIGCSDLLSETLQPGSSEVELLSEIRQAAERSASLTQQLLAFSRQQVLAPRVLDINEVVRDTERMLRRMIGEDVQLVTKLAPQIDRVKADPHQLQQVLMNLAVNARDAMPQGGVLRIETSNAELDEEFASTRADVVPGHYVLLAVADTGIGMTPEVKQRIFEPFFTTKEQGKGTGLGLPVVHGIVKQSQGHIEIYSEIGVGSVFKIYLPSVDQQVYSNGAEAARSAPQGHESILLVEDEPPLRNLGRRILENCGYRVLLAGNAEEALALYREQAPHFDLLLTDVVMPGMSGSHLAEKLRTLMPKLRVLYMSGYTDDAVLRHGILHAEVDFLQKPFTPNSLAHAVRRSLDR